VSRRDLDQAVSGGPAANIRLRRARELIIQLKIRCNQAIPTEEPCGANKNIHGNQSG